MKRIRKWLFWIRYRRFHYGCEWWRGGKRLQDRLKEAKSICLIWRVTPRNPKRTKILKRKVSSSRLVKSMPKLWLRKSSPVDCNVILLFHVAVLSENIAESYKSAEIKKAHCNTPDGKVPTGCAFGPIPKWFTWSPKGTASTNTPSVAELVR